MRILTAFYLFFTFTLYAQQSKFPIDYFASPLEIPVDLAASFGELRNNHFHAGIDLKTEQKEGLSVLASAAGFVSRIKISTYGYGKAIYITHPNGYTTVYGHILKFSPKIEAYIKERQYKKKTFEIELFPKATELSVTKGEIIALSGNTGGSGGPHLHFEFRDTKTEEIINPFYFGIQETIPDKKNPVIMDLVAYPLSETSQINQSELATTLKLTLQKNGEYMCSPVQAKGLIGFGINAYDLSNSNWNRKGLFHVKSIVNGSLIFEYKYDRFTFDESRYINAFIDYARYAKEKVRVQKLFIDNNIKLSTIKTVKNKGAIEVKPNLNYTVRLEVEDFDANKAIVNIPVVYDGKSVNTFRLKPNATSYFLKSAIENNLSFQNVNVFIPSNALYSNTYFDFKVDQGVATIHDETVPLHQNISISFDISDRSESELKGLFIAQLQGKRKSYNSTTIKNKIATIKTRNLGTYVLAQDVTPPTIQLQYLKEGDLVSSFTTISCIIKDDLSGINTYNAYINNQWILMEYDYKKAQLTFDCADATFISGKNQFKLEVSDEIGNTSVFETYFVK